MSVCFYPASLDLVRKRSIPTFPFDVDGNTINCGSGIICRLMREIGMALEEVPSTIDCADFHYAANRWYLENKQRIIRANLRLTELDRTGDGTLTEDEHFYRRASAIIDLADRGFRAGAEVLVAA